VQTKEKKFFFFPSPSALHRVFSSSKVDNILVKDTSLRIALHIDGEPIASKSHTHNTIGLSLQHLSLTGDLVSIFSL
jgi:hypothetical protein